MGEGRRGVAWLLALVLLLPAWAVPVLGEEERAPSLEFTPSSEVVPLERDLPREQPRTLFETSVGSYGIVSGSFDGPVDVAHDSEENYYVLDAGNSRVQKFSPSDRFILQWGGFGAVNGQFDNPRAIVIDDEDFVYVVDTRNHRIQKFDSEGIFIAAFGSLGSALGKFNTPIEIAFDGDDNFFVLDAGNDRIQQFTSAGEFIDEWGGFQGGRAGDFSDITSIAWFAERFGFLFLLGSGIEPGTCQVQMLQLKGGRREVVRSWQLAYPEDVECRAIRMEIDNNDDYVYILDSENSVLRRFTADGRYLDSIWESAKIFSSPMGFSIQEKERNIWLADTGNNIIQKFTLR